MDLIEREGVSGPKSGYAKCWKGVTKEHWQVMCDLVYKLVNQGYRVYTEASFKKGGRPDIIAILNGHGFIIEVLHSETDEKFEQKLNTYPLEYTILKVHTKDFDIDKFDI